MCVQLSSKYLNVYQLWPNMCVHLLYVNICARLSSLCINLSCLCLYMSVYQFCLSIFCQCVFYFVCMSALRTYYIYAILVSFFICVHIYTISLFVHMPHLFISVYLCVHLSCLYPCDIVSTNHCFYLYIFQYESIHLI